jgi:diguanylate cyclase (GGDEF)-like protein
VRVRGDDFVARVGGEEFIVGCAGGDPEVASQLGERLRASVAGLQMPMGVPGRSAGHVNLPKCTVSVGISAPFSDLAGRSRAMREADAALYAAKSRGRNLVVAFDESLTLSPGTMPVPLFQT